MDQVDHVQRPFRAGYSKSTIICDKCDDIINENDLCIEKSTNVTVFEDTLSPWFHLKCFFDRSKTKGKTLPKREGEIAQFNTLRLEDQEKIRKMIEEHYIPPKPVNMAYKRFRLVKEAEKTSSSSTAVSEPPNIEDDLDYEERELRAPPVSKLEIALQPLVSAMFESRLTSPEFMPRTIKIAEYKLNLDHMPWGRLTHDEILESSKLLGETLDLLDGDDFKGSSQLVLDEIQVRFFNLITTNFGPDFPPTFENTDMFKCKLNTLKYALDSQLGYIHLLKVNWTKDRHRPPSPLDTQYMTLQCNIKTLDKSSEIWNTLNRYFTKTRGRGYHGMHYHNTTTTLELENMFALERYDEDKRFEKFKNLHNRKLLWHGTASTNCVGILTEGLRIAMAKQGLFGKGIYFSDAVAKSVGYCRDFFPDGTLILLLCEVALGDEYTNSSGLGTCTKPPDGYHSVTCVRGQMLDESDFVVLPSGAVVPYAKSDSLPENTNPPLNEYIVYNEAQVTLRYLAQVKYKYPTIKV